MPKESTSPEALSKLIYLLGESQLLQEMDADKVIEFANRATILTYFNGEKILNQCDIADCFYFIIQGQMKIIREEKPCEPPKVEEDEFPDDLPDSEEFVDEPLADEFGDDLFDTTAEFPEDAPPEEGDVPHPINIAPVEAAAKDTLAAASEPTAPQIINYMGEGEFLGELALRRQQQSEDKTPQQRYATAEVIVDSIVARFTQADFDWLLKTYPQIEEAFQEIEKSYKEHQKITFPSIQPDEVGIINVNRHELWFFARLTPVFGLLLVGLVLSLLVNDLTLNRTIPLGNLTLWLFSLASVLWAIFEFVEWVNDDFIISSWRVIHIEKYVLGGVYQREVPLVQVLSVDVNTPNFFTRALGFDNVNIRPAGAAVVVFDGVRNGNRIKDIILHEQQKAKERSQASDIAAINAAVKNRIISRKVDVSPVEDHQIAPAKKGISFNFLNWLDFYVPRVCQRKDDGSIIWRRHLLVWVREIWQPVLFLLAVTYGIIVAMAGIFPFTNVMSQAVVALLALWFIGFGWYSFKHDNWRRISYEVTKSKIITRSNPVLQLRGADINETTFDNVQNISYITPNFWSKMFRLGNVEIKTASVGDPFIFKNVSRPEMVQQDVTNYLQKFKAEKEKKLRAAEEERFTRWLSEYHQLKDQPPAT